MSDWNKSWKASKQARKQRKYAANAPLHIARKFISSLLSKDLRKKYTKKNIPVKKGDTVKVMRGQFKGKTGKIEEVYVERQRVRIEGIELTKRDGTKSAYRLHPSKLMLTELNLEDQKRKKSLERKPKNGTKSLS